MKILITIPSLNDPGGVSNFFKLILPILQKKRESLDVKFLEVGSSRNHFFFHKITDQLRFIKALWVENPDLVHINPSLNLSSFIRDGLFAFWTIKFNKSGLVFFHGWDQKFENKINGWLKFFFKITFDRCDGFIVLAHSFKTYLQNLGVKKPVITMTTAVDPAIANRFSMEHKKKIAETTPYKILFLSRLEPEKGIFQAIGAIKILLEKKYSLTLSIAGDGSARNAVRDEIVRLGLSNHISMLGYLKGENKITHLLNHHLYCLPSYHGEGMPLSVLEAMVAGLPVVTRPVGGISDFFEDSKMGCLSQTPEASEIAGCIEKIISDKKTMLSMSEYNHRYAQNHFSSSHVAEKLITIYQQLFKPSPN